MSTDNDGAVKQTYGIKGRATWIGLASQGTASQYLTEGDVVALIPGTNADCARVMCLVINSGVCIVWCLTGMVSQ